MPCPYHCQPLTFDLPVRSRLQPLPPLLKLPLDPHHLAESSRVLQRIQCYPDLLGPATRRVRNYASLNVIRSGIDRVSPEVDPCLGCYGERF